MGTLHCLFCGGASCKYEDAMRWDGSPGYIAAIDGLYSSVITDGACAPCVWTWACSRLIRSAVVGAGRLFVRFARLFWIQPATRSLARPATQAIEAWSSPRAVRVLARLLTTTSLPSSWPRASLESSTSRKGASSLFGVGGVAAAVFDPPYFDHTPTPFILPPPTRRHQR